MRTTSTNPVIPSRHRGVERERDEMLPRILLIGLNPQRLLLQINVIPNRDGLLVLHIRRRLRGLHHGAVGVPPVNPIGMRRRVVVVVRSRKWHRHRRGRGRRRVIARVLVIRWGRSVGIGVLRRRVGRRRRENVAVCRDLRLRSLRRRRGRVVAPPARVPPPTLHPAAPNITHVKYNSPGSFLLQITNNRNTGCC